MSQREFERELQRHARQAGGSHLTIQNRELCLRRFADHSWSNGFQLLTIQSVKTRHVRSWLASMQAAGLSIRTTQNALAHLRVALREAGRIEYANRDLPTNAELGAGGGSRAGTKWAIPDAVYQQALARAAAMDTNVAAALALCRHLGLRSKEAVMSAKTLRAWEKALLQGETGALMVCHGTKGGRLRALPVAALPDPPQALEAVKNALQRIKTNRGHLIPKKELKAALGRFRYVARQVGLVGKHSPHSLRYAFACDAIDHLKSRHGLSRASANAAASQLLGHGDGRGRYIERVYGRREE